MLSEVERLRAEVERLTEERDGIRDDYLDREGAIERTSAIAVAERNDNAKLRAIVEAARESAHGEVGWSKFDRLLAEYDRERER